MSGPSVACVVARRRHSARAAHPRPLLGEPRGGGGPSRHTTEGGPDAMTYHLSRLRAADVADTMGAAFVIEANGRAVQKQRATGETEFLLYPTRGKAEAELGRVWDTFPTAGVHQREET